jgi:hypothetical protein
MKRLLIALAVIAVANPLFACINTYGTDLKGQAVVTLFEGDDLVEYLTMPHGPNWRAQKKKLSRNLSQASIEQQNVRSIQPRRWLTWFRTDRQGSSHEAHPRAPHRLRQPYRRKRWTSQGCGI